MGTPFAPQQALKSQSAWTEWTIDKKPLLRGYKVLLSAEAHCQYLTFKPGYERTMLDRGISQFASTPHPENGRRHSFYPTSWRKKRDPGAAGAYELTYHVYPGKIYVTEIVIDKGVFGRKDVSENEVSALYKVRKRDPNQRFNENINKASLENLTDSWSSDIQYTQEVKTAYAAINGMLNPLLKAPWLMGSHLEWAYKEDAKNIKEYTLFHNQSEGDVKDLFECIEDKLSITENAKYFASVLWQVQQSGRPVKWVAHSQGGIIFSRAVAYHNEHVGGSLGKNSVVFHSGGNNIDKSAKCLREANIQFEFPTNNPFDIVPRLGGGNDMSLSALRETVPFRHNLKGDDALCSPHTLPFISVSNYHMQLTVAGEHQAASRVEKYMNKNGIKVG